MKNPAAMPRKVLALASLSLLFLQASAHGGAGVRLPGHVPHNQIGHAHHIGHHDTRATLNLALVMKPHDEQGLADFVRRVQDPADPEYQHFLTPAEFKDRFAPTNAEVNDVLDFLRANGIANATVHDNNLVIDVEADARLVERAFQIELHEYQAADGRRVIAPNDDPLVSELVANRLHGIAGLSTFRRWTTHMRRGPALTPDGAGANAISSYMTPAKIKSAYGLSTAGTAGSGETLAVFELDGFNQSDIDAYTTQFGITTVTPQKVLVDGASGSAGANTDEVCLDIELMLAVSPGMSALKVYIGPNTDAGVLDTYNKIATDNVAKEISTSWGSAEDTDTTAYLNSENTIFQTMAAQGQSIFAAAGDSGAFDDAANPGLLMVDDPASQPYVTAVGGTTLTTAGGAWASESSWGVSSRSEGGGGGVSAVWSAPSWQAGLAAMANKGSHTQRMVPDVALDANPSTGYSIYTQGGWWVIGGTSASAPLWAAFWAQVNSARITAALARTGLANSWLYQLGQSSLASSLFHDIADSSTNLFYPAVSGYDLSTGWGSFQGSALVTALSSATQPPYPPSTVNTTNGALANQVTISWNAPTGATSYTLYRSSTLLGAYAPVYNGALRTYTDTLAAGTSYYYYVVATNAAGSSGASAKRAGQYNLSAPGAISSFSASGAP